MWLLVVFLNGAIDETAIFRTERSCEVVASAKTEATDLDFQTLCIEAQQLFQLVE